MSVLERAGGVAGEVGHIGIQHSKSTEKLHYVFSLTTQ